MYIHKGDLKMFKKNLSIIFLLFFSLETLSHQKVKGYHRKNGKIVQAYQRTRKNKNKFDNFSAEGNINPFTGKKGTKK